jgi:bacteriorhodopsin
MTNLIYTTGVLSLTVQVFTGIFDFFVLRMRTPHSLLLLKQLLLLEFVVQLIEGSFYVWMVSQFSQIKDITHFRYYDWFITTPTMLFTYSFYLLYLKYKKENKEIPDIFELTQENISILASVAVLNGIMLFFGYLGEIRQLSIYLSTFLGFIPFVLMFYLIYVNYAVFTEEGVKTFWYFSIVWGLYGVAALLPYNTKNVLYNILDLFAKNFFGIFLAITLLYSLQNTQNTQNRQNTQIYK